MNTAYSSKVSRSLNVCSRFSLLLVLLFHFHYWHTLIIFLYSFLYLITFLYSYRYRDVVTHSNYPTLLIIVSCTFLQQFFQTPLHPLHTSHKITHVWKVRTVKIFGMKEHVGQLLTRSWIFYEITLLTWNKKRNGNNDYKITIFTKM